MLKDLLKLRPRGDDPASIRASLAAAEEARAAAGARVAELRVGRAARLLDAPAAEVERAEAALADASAEAERLDALAAELARRLALAERNEVRANVDALRATAEKANAEWRNFVMQSYPALADKIAAGLALERAARSAAENANAALGQLLPEERERLAPVPSPFLPDHPSGANMNGIAQFGLGGAVRLPAANGDGNAPHWPKPSTDRRLLAG